MRHKKTAACKLYFMMNKAGGTVCSTVSDRRKTVYEAFGPEELVSPEGVKLHTVGRLDADTEGLLLFTNDGKLSNFLTRPESKIQKKYLVLLKDKVDAGLQQEYIKKAAEGIMLPPEKKAGPQQSGGAEIEFLDFQQDKSSASCLITLTEGKFHEVKRLFQALGNQVVFLKRTEMAGLSLDESLAPGDHRPLTQSEAESLLALFTPDSPSSANGHL